MPHESAIFVAKAFEVDSLREMAQTAFQDIMLYVRKSNLSRRTGYYNKMSTRIIDSFASATTTDFKLDHFISYQTSGTDIPVTRMTQPKWAFADGSLIYGGGMDMNLMMLKYPLTGDFSFQVVRRPHDRGGFRVTANGASFTIQTYNNSAVAQGLIGREQVKRKFKGVNSKKPMSMELSYSDDQVTFRVNKQDVMTETRIAAFPFVGLRLRGYAISEATDLVISGDPTIPRQVNLMHPRLRGWSSQVMGSKLPALHLPIMPEQDAKMIAEKHRGESKLEMEYVAWLVTDNELRTGNAKTDAEKHVHYQRPMLDGEKVSYQYWYDPEKTNVHPTIGRVIMMIREEGVKLRWMPQSTSAESGPPLNPRLYYPSTSGNSETDTVFDVEEVLGDGKPILKAGAWNTVELAAESAIDGDKVTITVNGEAIARVPMALDRRPGFLCEAKREARVRDISLSGDWPETLPEDLFSTPK